jgi:hypothetical protein
MEAAPLFAFISRFVWKLSRPLLRRRLFSSLLALLPSSIESELSRGVDSVCWSMCLSERYKRSVRWLPAEGKRVRKGRESEGRCESECRSAPDESMEVVKDVSERGLLRHIRLGSSEDDDESTRRKLRS